MQPFIIPRALHRLLFATAVPVALFAAGHAMAQEACKGGMLSVGYSADAVGLDPHISTALNSELMFQMVYSGLLKVNNAMAVEPDIATAWKVSDDGLVYTFTLRDGVKFHNGRPVTSDDVVYSFNRILGAKGAFSARFSDIKSIENPDPRTVVFTLKRPFAPFLSVLATTKAAIVPKEAVEQNGDLQKVMVGTGAFKFVEYRPGTSLTLERNPDYYDSGKPYLDRLVIKVIPDEVTRVAALRTGEVDFTQITDPLSLRILESDKTVKSEVVPLLRRSVLVLNVQDPPLNDPRVRQALSLAMDRQEVVDLALGGFGEVSGPFPAGLAAWALPVASVPFYSDAPNIEKAKQLLAEAGLSNGFTLTTYAAPQYKSHIPVAEVLQQQLAKIGVKLDIQVIEWGVLLDHWSKGTFKSITMTYAGRSDPYFYTFERLHSSSPGNASRLKNPEIDRLAEAGMSTSDPTARKKIYDELQLKMAETSAIIYIANETEQFAMKDGVQGYVGMPDGGRNYLADIWLKKACK
ncbi:putative D,D-dipeptide-binding periplasmic protein DdpA [Hyphomicrobiales bacterium]|nr:putative D,D-dipeptide-binding periplasmic protein DdpA [Hyphomicrobiales bacterium]CAH1693353.1 putative Di/tripeptide-binding protein 4 [Hyphomicrobiales bacterium]